MTTLNLQVNASNDDSRTVNGTTGFTRLVANYPLGRIGTSTIQRWDRFAGVTVPQGSTINSAILSFYTNAAASGTFGTIKLKSWADDTDDHAYPANGSDANTRPLTTGTAWADITSDPGAGVWISCDVVADVQTIINRGGWVSGNALGIRSGDNTGSNSLFIDLYHWDGNPSFAAKLDIDYTASGGPTPSSNLLLLGVG